MRLFTIVLLSAIALFRSCGCAPPQSIEQSTADRFRDSIGANLHLQYAKSAYRDERQVAKALDYIGVRHVRDGALRHGEDAFSSYVELAQHGVLFDLFLNADLLPQLSRVDRLEQAAPGAIDLLEGPNEINNDPVAFLGRSGVPGARAYQDVMYARAKADPKLSRLPVLNYTNWPPTGGRADAVNVHIYAKPGVDTRKRTLRDLELAAAALPETLPRYITETGYPTSLRPTSAPWVTPAQQANLILISLLEAFRLGVRRTYLYELFDESAPGDNNPEGHYGLFDIKGRPKPAAVALCAIKERLLQLQNLTGRGTADLHVRIHGATGLLLQGHAGSAVLFIWRPFNAATRVTVVLSQIERVSQVNLDGTGPQSSVLESQWSLRATDAVQVYDLKSASSNWAAQGYARDRQVQACFDGIQSVP